MDHSEVFCKTPHVSGRGGIRPSHIEATRAILLTAERSASRAEKFCKSLNDHHDMIEQSKK